MREGKGPLVERMPTEIPNPVYLWLCTQRLMNDDTTMDYFPALCSEQTHLSDITSTLGTELSSPGDRHVPGKEVMPTVGLELRPWVWLSSFRQSPEHAPTWQKFGKAFKSPPQNT